jgi:beta-lactam-binding protein with PASTA domain
VDAARYVGRPVAAVQDELTALGLTVRLSPVRSAGGAAGRVVGVDPAGSVVPGTTVTVTYAAGQPTPPKDDGGPGNGKSKPGKGPHG